MPNRRSLLKSCATAAVAGPALIGFAQQSVTLKFHTFMGPLSSVWLTMHKPWMERIEKASDGRIRFEPYAAMQLGGTAAQLYDQARDGVVDVVWTLPGYSANRFPRIEAFELPFMMTNAEATSRALWDYLATVGAPDFQETHLLAANVHGPGVLHTKDKLVRTVDDLRGLKLRGPSRPVTKLLGYLGATPVGLPLPGIPDALSKGTIAGCVLPWEVIPSVKVHELTRYHSEFSAQAGAIYTAAFVLVMNKKRYENLPAELRTIINAHSGMDTSGWLGKTQESNDPQGRKAATDRGNQVVTISATDTAEFKRKASVVEVEWIDELNKRGMDGRAMRDTARRLIEKHSRLRSPGKA